jgi:hypothetical protein
MFVLHNVQVGQIAIQLTQQFVNGGITDVSEITVIRVRVGKVDDVSRAWGLFAGSGLASLDHGWRGGWVVRWRVYWLVEVRVKPSI